MLKFPIGHTEAMNVLATRLIFFLEGIFIEIHIVNNPTLSVILQDYHVNYGVRHGFQPSGKP